MYIEKKMMMYDYWKKLHDFGGFEEKKEAFYF